MVNVLSVTSITRARKISTMRMELVAVTAHCTNLDEHQFTLDILVFHQIHDLNHLNEAV